MVLEAMGCFVFVIFGEACMPALGVTFMVSMMDVGERERMKCCNYMAWMKGLNSPWI